MNFVKMGPAVETEWRFKEIGLEITPLSFRNALQPQPLTDFHSHHAKSFIKMLEVWDLDSNFRINPTGEAQKLNSTDRRF